MAIESGDLLRVDAGMLRERDDDQINVYYLKFAGASPVDEAVAVDEIAEWLENIYTCMLSVMKETISFSTIRVSLVATGDPIGVVPWPTLTVGSALDDALPAQVACLASFPTATRRAVGKKYFGGFTEASNGENGFWLSVLVAAVSCAVAEILAAPVGAAPGDYLVGHLGLLDAFRVWESGIVDFVPRSQRRRVPGEGS